MESALNGESQAKEIARSWNGIQKLPANSAWRLLFDRRNLIPLIVAASMVIPVNLIGTFRLGELLVLALYPFYMKQILKALRNREVLAIVGLGVLWFISQGLSDLYNSTTMKNSLRGMGSIFLTMTTFLFFAVCIVATLASTLVPFWEPAPEGY